MKFLSTLWAGLITFTLVACGHTPLLEGAYSPPESADWFVSVSGSDSNTGRSPDMAFATINRAAIRARPGDIILVAPGTYDGAVITSRSGRPGNRITYISETPLGATIRAEGAYTAWDNTGNYVDIIGFEITGSDYVGIFSKASHVRVISNWVHDLKVPTCNSPNGGAGIQHGNYTAQDSETIGNIVNNIIPPGKYCNLVHGIYHAQQGGKIQNNIVFAISSAAIHNWHAATAVTITNNLVWGANTGILVGSDDAKGDYYIVNNNIVLNTERGIREAGGNFGTHNQYRNNILHNNNINFAVNSSTPESNIYADPQLVNFRTDGQGDYQPKATSPAINAGTSQGAPTTDILGHQRQPNTIDIGPFELQ